MVEDKKVLTAMMRGPHYDRGPLAQADFEGAAPDLARDYSRRMGGALLGAGQ